MKKNNRKLHELKGTISYACLGKSKSKVYKNQPFYSLEIVQESLLGSSKQTIYAFYNLVSSQIWNTLKKENYENKKYLFFCEKRVRGWRLKEWKELG